MCIRDRVYIPLRPEKVIRLVPDRRKRFFCKNTNQNYTAKKLLKIHVFAQMFDAYSSLAVKHKDMNIDV